MFYFKIHAANKKITPFVFRKVLLFTCILQFSTKASQLLGPGCDVTGSEPNVPAQLKT